MENRELKYKSELSIRQIEIFMCWELYAQVRFSNINLSVIKFHGSLLVLWIIHVNWQQYICNFIHTAAWITKRGIIFLTKTNERELQWKIATEPERDHASEVIYLWGIDTIDLTIEWTINDDTRRAAAKVFGKCALLFS